MQLKKIKLSGFKSFVDPTVLELRSPLMAIVGPNGCGKSNIIDAIRWVMGESSAKHLRGESMSDVIFNGSATRKPISQASVELCFDNTAGLGGEYAHYGEISVRRVGSREGESTYFLNGARCRRKDITDLFLGTGLGPRSYAIIQQGMIARIIEAKPEELRGFIEEAAGVSLYKRRRQETETRMQHTRENLERLLDLQQEIEKQLERLKRQSEAAERYQGYKQRQQILEAELAALRWQVLEAQSKEKAVIIQNFSTALEAQNASKTRIDLDLEKDRILYTEQTEQWKVLQGAWYALGADIARIEQQLEHQQERKKVCAQDLAHIQGENQRIHEHLESDQQNAHRVSEALAVLTPQIASGQSLVVEATTVVEDVKKTLQAWRQNFELFQTDAQNAQRLAEVERVRIEQLNRQSRVSTEQLERLQKEYALIQLDPLEAELRQVEEAVLSQERQAAHSATALQTLSTDFQQAKDQHRLVAETLSGLQEEYQTLRGRLSSVSALQAVVLGKTDEAVQGWLAAQGFNSYPRLAEIIQVEPGYERAVETVLGDLLQAVCLPGFSGMARYLETLETGRLSFIDQSMAEGSIALSKISLQTALHTKLRTDLPIHHLLAGVYVVDNLAEALEHLALAQAGESFITREGLWLGSHWLRVQRGQEGAVGTLERESTIKALEHSLEALSQRLDCTKQELIDKQQSIETLSAQRESLYRAQQEEAQILQKRSSERSALRANIEHLRTQHIRNQADVLEQQQRLQLSESEAATAHLRLSEALEQMHLDTDKRVILYKERETLEHLLEQALANERIHKEKQQTLRLEEKGLLTQKKAIEQGLLRLEQQKKTVLEREHGLKGQLETLVAPEKEWVQKLDTLLAERAISEKLVNTARVDLEALEQKVRALEKNRMQLEERALSIQTQWEQARLAWQVLQTRAQTIQESFAHLPNTLEDVLKALPTAANEPEWTEHLAQVNKRIERLGPINLAALEEYQSELERKNYLDAQQADLSEALKTLEQAIAKIDKETRHRFQTTFDQVNIAFQKLFPRLFGGGQATLTLNAEDALEAGVSVMARPPGKRNSSIHLLSGGEKALTAVAMVFAIFQLNPAPFCLLDEVDAPLDDANIGRFCDLVKDLSNNVQIIFITHNKMAIEIAHHLVGVTMKEAGVSRLVSVDIEEASRLVGA